MGLGEKLLPWPVLCFASSGCEGPLLWRAKSWECTGRKHLRRPLGWFGPRHKGSMTGQQHSDPAHRFGFPQKQTKNPTIVSLALLPQDLRGEAQLVGNQLLAISISLFFTFIPTSRADVSLICGGFGQTFFISPITQGCNYFLLVFLPLHTPSSRRAVYRVESCLPSPPISCPSWDLRM